MISENDKSDKQFCNLGARPKRSSLKKNGKYNRQKISFHQQSLDDALEMKNVNSMESLKEYQWDVVKKIDRKLSTIEPKVLEESISDKISPKIGAPIFSDTK